MVARTASPASDARLSASDPALRTRHEPVAVLEGLLATIFPDPPALDIMTVDDMLRRYPLTGLGAPALAAIEQSQRIVRARGEYHQVGLSEFHVGLIYLNWEDYRAAANQFAQARQPWLMAHDDPAQCLGHFAQGLALYHAFHNEPAMLHFGRAERMLNRPVIGAQATRMAALAARLRPLLTMAQETLRVNMWPADRPPEETRSSLVVPSSAVAESRPSSAIQRPIDNQRGTLDERTPVTADSASRLAFDRLHLARPERVPLPISNLPGGLGEVIRGPVPGHIVVDDRFGWYVVVERLSAGQAAGFLPALVAGSWLLADLEPAAPTTGRDYVIVGSRQARLGSIAVQPVSHSSAVPYCYLGYRDTGKTGGQLFLDDSQQPAAAEAATVLAVVEGIWVGLDGEALDAQPAGRG